MQNGQNSSQLLFRPSTMFGSKSQKFSFTKTFGFDQISYYIVSFMTEIFYSARISQLPKQEIT
jgi:hypothetical protein